MMPSLVEEMEAAATAAGFTLSCEPEVGRVLAVLAAAVPAGGAVLELGTGTGVGLAWLLSGLRGRTDVTLTSVEVDPEVAAVAATHTWPSFVRLEVGDAIEVVRRPQRWDLIFADAPGGKWEGLDSTITALAPGGILVVDDMAPTTYVDDTHRSKTTEVRHRLLTHPHLVTVEIAWSSGIMLSTSRHD
jgi:demethylmenaquinone methyltransferase/2-methoxy-6-polyprenyl-1,4-benzoquinol methylase